LVARTNAGWEGTEFRTNQRTTEERADPAGLDPRQRWREPYRREEGISSRAVRESRIEPEKAAEGRGMSVNYAETLVI